MTKETSNSPKFLILNPLNKNVYVPLNGGSTAIVIRVNPRVASVSVEGKKLC